MVEVKLVEYSLLLRLAEEDRPLTRQLRLPLVLRRQQDLPLLELGGHLTKCDRQLFDVASQLDLIALSERHVPCLGGVLLVELQLSMRCQTVPALCPLGAGWNSDFTFGNRRHPHVDHVWRINRRVCLEDRLAFPGGFEDSLNALLPSVEMRRRVITLQELRLLVASLVGSCQFAKVPQQSQGLVVIALLRCQHAACFGPLCDLVLSVELLLA